MFLIIAYETYNFEDQISTELIINANRILNIVLFNNHDMKLKQLGLIVACITVALALSGFNISQKTTATPLKSIADLQWQNRLLIISTNNLINLDVFMNELTANSLDERRLKIYALVAGESFELLPNKVLKMEKFLDEELSKVFNQNGQAYLIGLDGGIKSIYSVNELSYKTIANRIDGMPMRRAEL